MLSELACAAVSEVNGYQRVTGAFPPAARRRTSHPISSTCWVTSLRTRWPRRHGRGGVWVRGEGPASAGADAAAVIRIGDSGKGLPDAALQDLNEILAGRASPVGTGPGVGLVVTREIAHRHGLTVRFGRLVSGGRSRPWRCPMLFSSPRVERTQPQPGPTTRPLGWVRSHHVFVSDSVTFQPPVRTPAEGQGTGQGCPVLQTCWPARLSVLVRRDLGAGRK